MRSAGSPPLRSAGLQEQLVDELGTRIAAGELDAGTVLAPDQLAARYGVSRTVVREAFRGLEVRGMIRARARVGTLVQPAERWNLLDPDVILWRSRGSDADEQLRELMALREAVEPVAAALAASAGARDGVAALHDAVAAMNAAYANGSASAFADADARFHAALVATAGNRVFASLLGTLDATLTSRYSPRMPAFSEATPASMRQHAAVADAIAARDATAAERLMRELVLEAQRELFDAEAAR